MQQICYKLHFRVEQIYFAQPGNGAYNEKKDYNGINWNWLDEYTSEVIHIDDIYKGFISLVKVDKVKQKITVDYE